MTQLTEHFSVEEFTKSATAETLGIDNSLPDNLIGNATLSAAMMERIRAHLSGLAGKPVPLIPTSGYRCLALNRAKRSSDTSDHVRALAWDFRAPAFGTPFEVARALLPLVESGAVGQLIHEFGSWVHVSTRSPDKAINSVITISAAGTEVGIVA